MAYLIQQSRPSYKQGFARNQSESANPNLWVGAQGFWPAELGNTGENIRNVVASRNHGDSWTLLDSTDWKVWGGRYAIDFNAASNVLDMGDIDMTGWEACTQAAWVRFPVFNRAFAPFISHIHHSQDDIALFLWSNSLGFRMDDGSNTFVSHPVTSAWEDIWHFVVGTHDGLTLRIYVNGIERDSDTKNFNYGSATDNAFAIGARSTNPSQEWGGQIGNTYLWNRELKQAEIMQLYRDSNAPFRLRQFIGRVPDVGGGGLGIPIAAYHYNHHLGSMT